MSPLDLGIRRKILELWLRGIDYREIHARTSTSLGAISEVINSYKAEQSDLDQLRALGSKLPSDLDFAQVSTLLDSITTLQKQLNCTVEEVPSLVKSKIPLTNEIEELKQKRDSILEEIEGLEQTKQDMRFDNQLEQNRKNQLLQDIRIMEFQKTEKSREIQILLDAIMRGRAKVKTFDAIED